MDFEPVKLRHPDTGDEVEAASPREYNNLRFGSGYMPIERDGRKAKKDAPSRPKPTDPPSDSA